MADVQGSNTEVQVLGTVTVDTELPTAAALTDAAANPTTPSLGANNLVFDGTTWNRARGQAAVDGNAALSSIGIPTMGVGPGFDRRLDPANLGTAANSASTADVNGADVLAVQVGTTTTGTYVIETTLDGTTWAVPEAFDIATDLRVTGQSLTPTLGKVYRVLVTGMRQVRLRTNATLGATMAHKFNLALGTDIQEALIVSPAPHSFGYTPVHKDVEYTTAQTGAAIWTPASGKKFVVTDVSITTGGTTAGVLTLWQGASADTTYTVGTDPSVFRGEFAPSATVRPGAIKTYRTPFVSTTVDHILRITTSAALTCYVQVEGYEI